MRFFGLIADFVHFCLLRPVYGKRGWPAAKARWNGAHDFRREGVV